jgi:CelD/BcsL family acetyltransferase involved in cellulose biosynthesis
VCTITLANPVEISFLHSLPAWERIAGPWNDLLARAATDVPFLRSEFQRAWWTTLGGGEWPDGELWVAIGQDSDGTLLAAAPFFQTSSRPGALLFVGTSEIADYLDVLASEPDVEPFVRGVLEAIGRDGPPGVHTLDLWNVLETSPSGAAFGRAAAASGWTIARERLKPCSRISLAGGWDAYLERLDKKQRHELRRKVRRVEQTAGTAFARAGDGLDLVQGVEAFLRLMKFDGAKSRFLTQPMHDMFHALAADAAREGWLRLEFLTVEGRPAAGAFCFDYGDRLLIYNSGLDPAYLGLSPGWALLGHLIQTAADGGKSEVDFMRGDEEYKFRLGGEARYIERLTLRRRSL